MNYDKQLYNVPKFNKPPHKPHTNRLHSLLIIPPFYLCLCASYAFLNITRPRS